MSSKNVIKPDFFIVGAPKSGTTAMNSYLDRHPQVFMSYRKEMHFFGSDLVRIPHEFFVLDEKRYLSMFSKAAGAVRIGEASVMYLYSKNAAREIAEFNPESRIMIMLRNPVDMLYAYHSQLYWGGYENIASFTDALSAEEDRRAGRRIPPSCMMPNALYYTDVASYSEQVRRFLDVFGADRVHIVLFDDFRRDLAGVFRKTLEFLDVEPLEVQKFKAVNTNKVPRIHHFQELIQRPPWAGRALLRLMPDEFRYWFLGKLSRLNTRLEPRPPLDEETRQELAEYFSDDVSSLGDVIGRDLSGWCLAGLPSRQGR